MKRLNEIIKLTGAAFLGAMLAGSIAWAANGFIIFGSGGDAATVTNHKLDVNASVTLGGTSDMNLKQVNGATVNVGTGAASTGTARVAVSSDSTIGLVAGSALVGKVGIDQTTPGTTNLVALAANQSVNAAQINGVTPLMGNGTTGTGSQRVTVASDNTPFPIKIDQTTPDSTNLVSVKPSIATAVFGTASQTSTTSTSLIGAVAAKSIYVTAFNCANSGATASTILFQDGSGGTTLAVTYNPAGSGTNQNSGGGAPLFKTTAGNALFFAPGTGSTTQFCTASGFSQ